MSSRRNGNPGLRAAKRFAGWRAEGHPLTLTHHEAWLLTAGRVGTEGDHATAINLSTVASRMETSR